MRNVADKIFGMVSSLKKSMGKGLVLTIALTTSAQAHEFWLLPQAFQIQPGASLMVDLKNGQQMKGKTLPYLPSDIARFELVGPQGRENVTGRAGDVPALTTTVTDAGLLVIVHETRDRTVTYDDFALFERFVTHKAAPQLVAAHKSRNLPLQGFTESYRRYAKSLVAVGDGAGADTPQGLDIEIVAMANPYTDNVSAGLPLMVLRQGAPVAGAQIELFAKGGGGGVTVSMHQTDARGIAMVPARSGTTYLADTVEISALDNDDAAAGPVWHSIWASLTYLVP